MNMTGTVTTITKMNEKLDKLTNSMKELSQHTGQLTHLLRQLIQERVENGHYNDLLVHPNQLVRDWTKECLNSLNNEKHNEV